MPPRPPPPAARPANQRAPPQLIHPRNKRVPGGWGGPMGFVALIVSPCTPATHLHWLGLNGTGDRETPAIWGKHARLSCRPTVCVRPTSQVTFTGDASAHTWDLHPCSNN